MSKVQAKNRGVANITNNILFIHYFIHLFLLILIREGNLYTCLMCYINQHLHSSMSQQEQPDLVKDSLAHGRGVVLDNL